MFTGIIEALGTLKDVSATGTNKTFWITSDLSQQLTADQSVSHNGVCLTVEETRGNMHRVTAVQETLQKSSLRYLKEGDLVNLERCVQMNGRLDGHIVQGHVDTTGNCIARSELNGSWEFRFQFPGSFAGLVIEKGSISLDGVSLTIFNVSGNEFSVAIVPYTFEHTNINQLKEGSLVNLEFDMIGKYVQRNLLLRQDGYRETTKNETA